IAIHFELANFEFVKYKTPPSEGWKPVTDVLVAGRDTGYIKTGIERGQIIAGEVNACRALSNTPGGDMTPRLLAEEARNAAKNVPVDVTVLGKNQMEQIGMGGVLGVARGSNEEPQFIILSYRGCREKEKPIVLVGKGVTFDTGGLNLKPSEAIYEMHMDMSGGAAVIHAVVLAAKLRLKKNVIGLVPAVENMPSGSSYHPGDVLKSLSGKTIEVLNTDAEGRIILADGITYAKRYNPKLVVDVATLTGAAMAALGQRCSAIFTEDQKLERQIRALGEESGDYVWPLPLWDEYEEEIKGTFGDVANIGKTRYGGAITAAKFLHSFAKELGCPWIHIDMAPRMTSIDGEYLAKGAAGVPVRLLLRILETI
ncbi:MAG: leucyl aminopeptidase family protein, partial [Patescibacteria group bacterium]